MAMTESNALILGGSGLVGYQVARRLAETGEANTLVLCALGYEETRVAVTNLREEFPSLTVRGYSGNLFLPGDPVVVDAPAPEPPVVSPTDPVLRRRVFDGLYNDFETAYRESLLARLIDRERPRVVVDSVNTATGISYQDVFTASQAVRADLDRDTPDSGALREDVEKLLISLSLPQLILHARILTRALTEAGTRLYLKIGTTGTGGMGLNIPYTHGEEKPSPQLLNKTAIAFAHTGMLFLMGRTPGGPIIKEVKPAALIGYRGVAFRAAVGRQFHPRADGSRWELGPAGEPYTLYRPRAVTLESELDLTPDPAGYETLTGPDGTSELKVPLVDTGENGLFTRGEFEAITSLDQMEYITPEEIADIVVMEVRGAGTGQDIIAAVDSAVLGSTYKAGLLRPAALGVLRKLEEKHGVPSVALGRLGPPDLAKHLFEAHLFKTCYETLDAVSGLGTSDAAAGTVSRTLYDALREMPMVASLATSIGIPVLCPDGKTLLRGPMISAPPYRSFRPRVPVDPVALEGYARTWVDLRPARMRWWLLTFALMAESRRSGEAHGWATARVTRRTYLYDDIRIGAVVAWIFGSQGEGFRVL